jgi:predicted GIY-YIG superfamily endonuclease
VPHSGVDRLTVEEELRFLDQAYVRDGRTGLMLQTLLETGLRASELVQLRIEDVSLAEGVVIVHQGKGGKRRGSEHRTGVFDGYTARQRPMVLVLHQEFDRIIDAIAAERQVKGWRREKKEALIRGDFAALPALSRRAAKPGSEFFDDLWG